ncbi:hypothetical protein EV702DRAFT_1041149 [Suillus placidus]|uniref:Uncharacterized protein n=1 Tax=Suillus placidus TaxID=48579 RepID=A0A9P7A4I0_9AGAM|nr:hypothetical protein EV702DRAFT_1041149 [Suillus placidus]
MILHVQDYLFFLFLVGLDYVDIFGYRSNVRVIRIFPIGSNSMFNSSVLVFEYNGGVFGIIFQIVLMAFMKNGRNDHLSLLIGNGAVANMICREVEPHDEGGVYCKSSKGNPIVYSLVLGFWVSPKTTSHDAHWQEVPNKTSHCVQSSPANQHEASRLTKFWVTSTSLASGAVPAKPFKLIPYHTQLTRSLRVSGSGNWPHGRDGGLKHMSFSPTLPPDSKTVPHRDVVLLAECCHSAKWLLPANILAGWTNAQRSEQYSVLTVQILLVSFLPKCRELVQGSNLESKGTPSFSSALILPYIPGVIILRMTTIDLVVDCASCGSAVALTICQSDQNDNGGKPMARAYDHCGQTS